MILPHDTTIAVADGTKMRLFRNKGMEPHIQLVELPPPDVHAGNTGSGTRHRSSTANPDGGRLAEDNFAASAAGYLNRQVLSGAMHELFVIADPRTLGEMRRHFHAALQAKLVGDLAKNLTDHSLDDVEAALHHV